MYGAIVKSTIFASLLGAFVLVAAMTASSLAPVSTTLGQKGDVLVAAIYHACETGDCNNDSNDFGGFRTSVVRDVDNGLITLNRSREVVTD